MKSFPAFFTTFILAAALLLGFAFSAKAAPVSWDFAGGVLQPLQSAWNAQVKGAYFTATSSSATSTFPQYTGTTGAATTFCLSGDCRSVWPTSGGSGTVGTSSAETATHIPFWTSTNGSPALLSGGSSNFTWDGTKLFAANASTTNLSIGSLTGVLKAASGVVSTGLVNLASEVTGVLPAANGGTGTTTPDLVYFKQNGNSFGGLATLGTDDTNALAFETAGSERMRILSGGNVGIGTTNPAQNFVVSNAGTAGFELAIASNATAQCYNRNTSAYCGLTFDGSTISFRPNGSAMLTANTTGVGIGTTSPASRLTVETGTSGDGIYLRGTSSAANHSFRLINDAGVYTSMFTVRSGGGTDAGKFFLQTNSGTTAMVIDTSQRVGIGNTSPAQRLSVTGDGTVSGYLYAGSNSAPTNTTAGDLTATRISIGNGSLSGNLSTIGILTGSITATSSTAIGVNINPTIAPTANSSAGYRALAMTNTLQAGSFNLTASAGSSAAGFFGNNITSIGDITAIGGIASTGLGFGSGSSAAGTITEASGGYFRGLISSGNSLTSTITRTGGVRIFDSINAGSGPLTITGQYGLMVDALDEATNNSSIVIGQSTVPTGNFGIYSATTNSSYFAGSLGIGTSSPSQPLTVSGNARITGALYDSTNSAGSSGNCLTSTVTGTAWASCGGGGSATTTINGTSGPTFSFLTGTSGTDFNIATSSGTVTFNLPTASATNRGALSSADWITFNSKAATTTSNTWAGTQTFTNQIVVSSTTGTSTFAGGLSANTLSIGSLTGVLKAVAGAVTTGLVNLATEVTGILATANGGTGLSSYATGDLIYSSATNVLSKLGIGSTGQVLSVSGGVPTWVATSTLNISSTVKLTSDTLAVPTTQSTTTVTHLLGRTPTFIALTCQGPGGSSSNASYIGISTGTWDSTNGQRAIYNTSGASSAINALSGSIARVYDTSGSSNYMVGTVANVGSTSFDIGWVETGDITQTVRCIWETE